MADHRSLWTRYLVNHELDYIQIWRDDSLGISHCRIKFWGESIRRKMADSNYLETKSTWQHETLNIRLFTTLPQHLH